MALANKTLDAARKAVALKDYMALSKILDEAAEEEGAYPAGEGTHVHIHNAATERSEERTKFTDDALEDKFQEHGAAIAANHKLCMDAIQDLKNTKADKETSETDDDDDEVAEELPDDVDGARVKKTTDSVLFASAYQRTVELAEIISPGIQFKILDAAAAPRTTYATLCDIRKRALTAGLSNAVISQLINGTRGKTTDAATVGKLTCASTRTLFNAVGVAKQAINATAHVGPPTTRDAARHQAENTPKAPTTIAEINARNAAHYAGKK